MAISPTLARRLDRLARRAHAFHRHAHHPLCDRYAGELIRVGRRRRVCRGCSAAWLGVASGALLGQGVAIAPGWAALAALLGLALFVMLGWPRAPASPGRRAGAAAEPREARPRLGKLVTRALPSLALCFGLSAALRSARVAPHTPGLALGLALGIGVAIVLGYQLYRRRTPDRTPCVTCPERLADVPCSGFRDIVRAERAFMRRSQQLLDRAAR